MCVFIFSITFVWNIYHSRRSEQDMIKNVYWSYWKTPLFLSDINETCIFSTYKNTQISNFMKIHLVRAELFYADGRTEGQGR